MIPYALGLPIWAFPAWKGRLFTRRAKPADFLSEYSRVFNTVEGNTTFYQVPSAQTVERWGAAVAPGFRFALKMPRRITHELGLVGKAAAEAQQFAALVAPLGDHLGPFLLQLPPRFGLTRLADLDAFLTACRGIPFAVEVRHAAFWRDPGYARLNDCLAKHGAERALMDTRALRAAPADDEHSRQARQRKPDLPVHPIRIGDQPFIRIVTHLEPSVTRPVLDQWAQVVARWLGEGCHPWIFIHTPGEHWAPEVARAFHERVQAHRAGVAALPEFPGEAPEGGQLGLL